jgi:hypothetical protein
LSTQQIKFIRSDFDVKSCSLTGNGGVIVTTTDNNVRALDSNGELQIMSGYTPSEPNPVRLEEPSQGLLNVNISEVTDEQLGGLNLSTEQIQTIQSYRSTETNEQINLIVGDRVLLSDGDYAMEIQPDGRTRSASPQNPSEVAPPSRTPTEEVSSSPETIQLRTTDPFQKATQIKLSDLTYEQLTQLPVTSFQKLRIQLDWHLRNGQERNLIIRDNRVFLTHGNNDVMEILPDGREVPASPQNSSTGTPSPQTPPSSPTPLPPAPNPLSSSPTPPTTEA